MIASREDGSWHIETIGYKGAGPQRAKDFFESFFRAVSRIKDGASRIAIALPSQFHLGLPQRAAQYGVAWLRIGDAFPEVEIWLVDCATSRVTRSSWNSWLITN